MQAAVRRIGRTPCEDARRSLPESPTFRVGESPRRALDLNANRSGTLPTDGAYGTRDTVVRSVRHRGTTVCDQTALGYTRWDDSQECVVVRVRWYESTRRRLCYRLRRGRIDTCRRCDCSDDRIEIADSLRTAIVSSRATRSGKHRGGRLARSRRSTCTKPGFESLPVAWFGCLLSLFTLDP